jgi:hypothetical protein
VHHSPRLRIAPLVTLLLLAACDTRAVTEPALQPQVINLRNDFAFQATGLIGVTEDVVYTWQSDGTAASVVQAPTRLTGDATLFILDGAGVQVYQRSLAENGTFATTTGVPGAWTVRFHFADASGDVGLRLQKQ